MRFAFWWLRRTLSDLNMNLAESRLPNILETVALKLWCGYSLVDFQSGVFLHQTLGKLSPKWDALALAFTSFFNTLIFAIFAVTYARKNL